METLNAYMNDAHLLDVLKKSKKSKKKKTVLYDCEEINVMLKKIKRRKILFFQIKNEKPTIHTIHTLKKYLKEVADKEEPFGILIDCTNANSIPQNDVVENLTSFDENDPNVNKYVMAVSICVTSLVSTVIKVLFTIKKPREHTKVFGNLKDAEDHVADW